MAELGVVSCFLTTGFVRLTEGESGFQVLSNLLLHLLQLGGSSSTSLFYLIFFTNVRSKVLYSGKLRTKEITRILNQRILYLVQKTVKVCTFESANKYKDSLLLSCTIHKTNRNTILTKFQS